MQNKPMETNKEMKISEHVVREITAAKLKAYGWDKKTLHYWIQWSSEMGGNGNYFLKVRLGDVNFDDGNYIFIEPAPLATELLEELPKFIKYNNKIIGALSFNFDHIEQKYWVSYGYTNKLPITTIFRDKLHEALAEMWIMLKEYNLITTP